MIIIKTKTNNIILFIISLPHYLRLAPPIRELQTLPQSSPCLRYWDQKTFYYQSPYFHFLNQPKRSRQCIEAFMHLFCGVSSFFRWEILWEHWIFQDLICVISFFDGWSLSRGSWYWNAGIFWLKFYWRWNWPGQFLFMMDYGSPKLSRRLHLRQGSSPNTISFSNRSLFV